MAYLVFNVKGRELGRRPLEDRLVIGRSPHCDVCVHDILLSRRHCQFERSETGWTVVDLASKNGTYLGIREIGRHELADGECVQIGKTIVTFRAGKYAPAARASVGVKKDQNRRQRPADPWEAMNATLSGVDYSKAREQQKKQRLGAKAPKANMAPVGATCRLPSPQPTPPDPHAYQSEDIYSLLTDLASSSWDSIYMNASRPLPQRPAPRPIVANSRHSRYRSSSPTPIDLSLQVTSDLLASRIQPREPRRWKRAVRGMARGFMAVGKMVMVLGLAHLLAKI